MRIHLTYVRFVDLIFAYNYVNDLIWLIGPSYGGGTPKVSKEKNVKLPWCGLVDMLRCKSVVWSGGLHLQCEGIGVEYCVRCAERVLRDGINKMGRVEDRLSKGLYEYIDGYGRRSVSYVKYMLRNGLSREDVEIASARECVLLSSDHFVEKDISRGRPRKSIVKLECEEVGCDVVVEKKKRGRPRKEKEVCSNVRGEELIASLIEDAQLEKREEVADGEETRVIRFKINGIEYLKSEDNVLYDNKSHEAVGIWNENSGSIDDIPNEEE
jgi:hypothetical protein